MTGRLSIFAVVVSLSGGCDTSAGPEKMSEPNVAGQKTRVEGKSRSENRRRESRYPDWLEATAAPSKLKAAQQLAENQQRMRFEAILNRPERVFVDSEVLHVLHARRKTVVERLRAILAEGTSKKAHGAAALLFELDEPDGIAYFKRVLKDGATEQRAEVLNRLSSIYRKRSKLQDDKSLHGLLLSQLDDRDPRVLKAAIQVCGILRVPGAAQRFAKLVQQKDTPDRGRLFYWLSQLDPQPEHVTLLARQLRMMGEKKRDHWSFVALTDFARSKNRDVSRAALKLVREMFLRTQGENHSLRNYDRVQVIQILVSQSDKADLPWLRTLLKQKLPSYVLANVMGKLAKLEGQAGRTRIVAVLDDPKLRIAAAQQIGRLFRGSQDVTLVNRLKHVANDDKRQYARSAIAEALLAIGGDEA